MAVRDGVCVEERVLEYVLCGVGGLEGDHEVDPEEDGVTDGVSVLGGVSDGVAVMLGVGGTVGVTVPDDVRDAVRV